MKKYKLLLFVAVAGLALGSCSKDGIEDQPGGKGTGEIRFEIGFAPDTRVVTDAAYNSTWETGDQIGIFAVRHAASGSGTLVASDNFIHNVRLTYDGTAWATDAGVNLYYPNNGDQLDFYAYYPYDDNGASPATLDPSAIAFNVKADQSAVTNIGGTDKPNYNLSDLLSASAINIARSATAVNLTFAHKLALVEVDITNKEVNVPHYDATLTVQLHGVQTASTLDLGAGTGGTVTASGTTGSVTMRRVEQPADANYLTKFTYRALVPAQSVAAGDLLSMIQTTSGSSFNFGYSTTAATALTAAKAHLYAVKTGWGIDANHLYAIGDPFPHIGRVIGVVFWLDAAAADYVAGPPAKGKKGKIVSLDEGTDLEWGPASTTTATNFTDGRANMSTIASYISTTPSTWTDFPTFNWVIGKNGSMGWNTATDRWYLPAMDELKALYAGFSGLNYGASGMGGIAGWDDYTAMPDYSNYAGARTAFNGKLTAAGGTAISAVWYWSSSQYGGDHAWGVYFDDGYTSYGYKDTPVRVRAVLAF